jgi:hypothetical protein
MTYTFAALSVLTGMVINIIDYFTSTSYVLGYAVPGTRQRSSYANFELLQCRRWMNVVILGYCICQRPAFTRIETWL